MLRSIFALFAFCFFAVPASAKDAPPSVTLLNVSFDPTREFYEDYNKAFAAHWKKETGGEVTVRQSHGGSAKQARAVIDGLKADVVTLALAYDIDAIAERSGAVPADWETRLPNRAVPHSSTIVFLVPKGNPKRIKDWGDLTQAGLRVGMPNPKTSGGARWVYLAAFAYASERFGGEESKIRDYMGQMLRNIPMLDTGARAATTNFAKRHMFDVLLTWENEAMLAREAMPGEPFDVVYPSMSIEAEPVVAMVPKVAEGHGAAAAAEAYVKYLYSEEGQEIAAKHYLRPINPDILARHRKKFPEIRMVTVQSLGGWGALQHTHFSDGGWFDQLSARR